MWQYRLFLAIPEGAPADAEAVLVIGGGSWRQQDAEPVKASDKPQPKEAMLLSMYAQQLNCPVVLLLNVPRQPIFEGRKEDAIIALTFDRYLQTGETDWPLLLPMVKSVARAMDAVQAFAADDLKRKISHFTVTGASKRGWTTWLIAAVDPRVRALAPLVIDMLNLEAQFDHQLRAYGAFSRRIHDYTDRDLPNRMSGEAGAPLRQIIDPYSYRKEIVQPKLIILGTNDGFWTLDALNLYWDGLEGEKYIIYVPNADHDLANDFKRILGGLRALHRHAGGEAKLPRLTWTYAAAADNASMTLTVRPATKDARVLLWTAESPTRDFRQAKWTSAPVPTGDQDVATARLDRPAQGYRAMFAEVVYGDGLLPLHLSTQITVLDPRSTE